MSEPTTKESAEWMIRYAGMFPPECLDVAKNYLRLHSRIKYYIEILEPLAVNPKNRPDASIKLVQKMRNLALQAGSDLRFQSNDSREYEEPLVKGADMIEWIERENKALRQILTEYDKIETEGGHAWWLNLREELGFPKPEPDGDDTEEHF